MGAMACSEPQRFESPAEELTPARAQVVFALPTDHGDTIVLVVDQVTNPAKAPIAFVAESNGLSARPPQLTLYPADRPARFAIEISPDATHVSIALRSKGRGGTGTSPSVRVRITGAADE